MSVYCISNFEEFAEYVAVLAAQLVPLLTTQDNTYLGCGGFNVKGGFNGVQR